MSGTGGLDPELLSLTVATEDGRIYPAEFAETDTVERVHALVEAETGVPAARQGLFYEGRLLSPTATLRGSGISNFSVLLLRFRKSYVPSFDHSSFLL